MNSRILLIPAAILLSASCTSAADDDPREVQELKRGMPEDVASFISRLVECNHWGGEEPYDKERAKQIGDAAKRLRCNELNNDEQKLVNKYKNNPEILSRIDKAKNLSL